jgi:hypothetical protein
MPFPRHCRDCDNKFKPSGRTSKLCDACFLRIRRNAGKKRKESKIIDGRKTKGLK